VAAAAQALGAGGAQPALIGWTALVGAGAAAARLRSRRPPARGGWLRAALVIAGGWLLSLGLLHCCGSSPGGASGPAGWPLLGALVPALAGELAVRGVLQPGLEQLGGGSARAGRGRIAAAALASACAAWAAFPPAVGPLATATTLAAAALPAAGFALTGRPGVAIAVRLALLAATGH
jgi:hypothetical protein